MTVTVPSGSSTDKRLDDLNRKVDAGFVRVEGDIRDLRTEMVGLRTEVKGEMESLRTEVKGDVGGLRAEMNARFEAVDARFDSLQRTLLGGAVAIVVALIGSSAFG